MEPYVWIVVLFTYLICEAPATDIGYLCQSDQECKAGNGGEYSRCDGRSSRCLCKYNHMGEENIIEFDGDELKCHQLLNSCTKKNGCLIQCFAEEFEDILECTTVLFCSEKSVCSAGCQPKDLWRFDANQDWYGPITKPFTSLFVPDKKTSLCYDPDRAKNSRPKGIVIKTSTLPGAGLGTFSEAFIPRGTIYGPYKGRRVFNGKYNASYSWLLEGMMVDGSDKSLSNWLRYINCPNTPEMENLYPVIYQGEMYYYAFKSIKPGTELMIYYGNDYASRLGIKNYTRPKYTFAKDRHAGGSCLGNLYIRGYPFECFSQYASCISGICMCENGTRIPAGSCVADEHVGGKCNGKNGEVCLNDKNAECWKGVCVCNKNATEINRLCVHDEAYGGVCNGQDGEDCRLDKNAECVNGLCDCKYGMTEVFGKCVDIHTDTVTFEME